MRYEVQYVDPEGVYHDDSAVWPITLTDLEHRLKGNVKSVPWALAFMDANPDKWFIWSPFARYRAVRNDS